MQIKATFGMNILYYIATTIILILLLVITGIISVITFHYFNIFDYSYGVFNFNVKLSTIIAGVLSGLSYQLFCRKVFRAYIMKKFSNNKY